MLLHQLAEVPPLPAQQRRYNQSPLPCTHKPSRIPHQRKSTAAYTHLSHLTNHQPLTPSPLHCALAHAPLSLLPHSTRPSHPHSDHRAQQEPDRRSPYNRHYAFKGRGRKEFLRTDMKDDVNELVFTKSAVGV